MYLVDSQKHTKAVKIAISLRLQTAELILQTS